MKKFIEKITVCIIICIILLTNSVWGMSLTTNKAQKISFNYSVSSAPVGNAGLQQISINVKVENCAVSALQFRLGWDDTVVTPSAGTNGASNVNMPVSSGISCFNMDNKAIDAKGNTIQDYMEVNVANMDTINNYVYYIMSLKTAVLSSPTGYPLLDSDRNLSTSNEISMGTLTFTLREGKTEEDINRNTFFLITSSTSLPVGLKMLWFEGNKEKQIIDASLVKFVNFPGVTSDEIDATVVEPTPEMLNENGEFIALEDDSLANYTLMEEIRKNNEGFENLSNLPETESTEATAGKTIKGEEEQILAGMLALVVLALLAMILILFFIKRKKKEEK